MKLGMFKKSNKEESSAFLDQSSDGSFRIPPEMRRNVSKECMDRSSDGSFLMPPELRRNVSKESMDRSKDDSRRRVSARKLQRNLSKESKRASSSKKGRVGKRGNQIMGIMSEMNPDLVVDMMKEMKNNH
ncbi:expressed unknown protein [Seminavis robusta]|uniref:Uncharacterized protein n=1 Tax=Seminavis robusta TaxID=568900 RepID=A0A9N8ELU5_9STRA|nr:expressed unknown protein [Seminavis robusta]|eukprot:Sro1502_g277990.1 n/a (130) ;mRNA; f:16081-16470